MRRFITVAVLLAIAAAPARAQDKVEIELAALADPRHTAVLVVDVQDPLASKLNDIEDVERHLPGLVRATNEWFRYAPLLFLPTKCFPS